jgi:hypothetical protein
MRRFPAIFALLSLAILFGCEGNYKLKNETRRKGYARGEKVELRFTLLAGARPPDSINVRVLEKKTGYEYSDWACKDSCDTACFYTCIWDGRKPDGRWPAGGRYLVYAIADREESAFSDTVTIGLGD